MLYTLDACVWSGTKHFIIFIAHSHTCIRVMCLAIVHSWMHRRKLVQCPTQGCFIVQTGGVREGTAGSGSSRVVQGVIRKFKNQRTLPYLNIVRQTEVSSPKVVPPTAGICASYAGSLLVSFCSGSRTNVVNRLLHS